MHKQRFIYLIRINRRLNRYKINANQCMDITKLNTDKLFSLITEAKLVDNLPMAIENHIKYYFLLCYTQQLFFYDDITYFACQRTILSDILGRNNKNIAQYLKKKY